MRWIALMVCFAVAPGCGESKDDSGSGTGGGSADGSEDSGDSGDDGASDSSGGGGSGDDGGDDGGDSGDDGGTGGCAVGLTLDLDGEQPTVASPWSNAEITFELLWKYGVEVGAGDPTRPDQQLGIQVHDADGDIPYNDTVPFPGSVDLPHDQLQIEYLSHAGAGPEPIWVRTGIGAGSNILPGTATGTVTFETLGEAVGDAYCGSANVSLSWTDGEGTDHVLSAAATFAGSLDQGPAGG